MKLTEEQIFDLIDGNLSAETEAKYKQIIAENPDTQDLYEELLAFHKELQSLGTEHPSMRFTENVLDKWATMQVIPIVKVSRTLPYWFLGISLLLLCIMAIFAKNYTPNTTLVTQTEKWISLLNNATGFKIFVFTNAILLILLLDKAILRPYFQKRLTQK
jgi:hypothetical protein